MPQILVNFYPRCIPGCDRAIHVNKNTVHIELEKVIASLQGIGLTRSSTIWKTNGSFERRCIAWGTTLQNAITRSIAIFCNE